MVRDAFKGMKGSNQEKAKQEARYKDIARLFGCVLSAASPMSNTYKFTYRMSESLALKQE